MPKKPMKGKRPAQAAFKKAAESQEKKPATVMAKGKKRQLFKSNGYNKPKKGDPRRRVIKY